MSGSLFGDDQSSEDKIVVEEIDDYRLIRDLLDAKRLAAPICGLYKRIVGTRVWDNRFENTDLPLLLECKATDESGNLFFPDMMFLTKKKFQSLPRGRTDDDGELTREIAFGELPIVSRTVLKDLNYVER